MRFSHRSIFHWLLPSLAILTLFLSSVYPAFSQASSAAVALTNPLHVARPLGSSFANFNVLMANPQASMNLVYSDEFNGSAIDTNKWTTCFWWDNNGCTIVTNHELEWYQPGNVLVSDGTLKLQARKSSPIQATNGHTYNYTSGIITTGPKTWDTGNSPKFTFTYGYVEFRAKVPRGVGLWPTLWLLPATMNSLPEIDIMEILGNDPTTMHMHFHYQKNGQEADDGVSWVGPDFSTDWHTYAVDWEPNAIIWYVDGVERRRFTDTAYIPKEPMYLLANLAVGGDWPGSPNAQTAFPSNLEIDYLRVWQNNGQAPTTTPPPATPTPTPAPTPTTTPVSPVNGAFTPIADSAVDGSAPATNFGSSNTLNVDGDPTKVSYLKFDTRSLAGKTITAAKLRIRTTTDSSAGSTDHQAVKLVEDSSWSESGLTFNNRPALSSTSLGSLTRTVPNSSYEITLNPALLQAKIGTVFTLALDSAEGDGLYFYSRENTTSSPQLIITAN